MKPSSPGWKRISLACSWRPRSCSLTLLRQGSSKGCSGFSDGIPCIYSVINIEYRVYTHIHVHTCVKYGNLGGRLGLESLGMSVCFGTLKISMHASFQGCGCAEL